uniref:Transposase Tc1-like domain-containing protein n=1 Tax=Oncorhynchus tshawytscha TaxID=74940 RepID=A0AAZ3RXX5_ONCTS
MKMSRTLKVSSSAVAKTIKRCDETGSHKDRHRKGRPRVTSAAEDKFIRVTSLRNCNPNKMLQSSCNRHISTSTVQRRLRESGLYGRIAAKKSLLKDTNKKKRLAWAKKHEQWTLDRWKYVLWSDESKFEIFGSNRRVFVKHKVGKLKISACVVPTVKHGGGGMVLSVIYLEFKAHLTSMATTAFCSDTPSHLV